MKVGTDGVLLGAWAVLPPSGYVLDVGTGSGLIALMMAQRGQQLRVTGIDIDAEAVAQAQANAGVSPFADRVEIRHCSLQEFVADAHHAHHFDSVVCNPPFFEQSLLSPDPQRSLARHTDSLPFTDLVACAATLLKTGGRFSVILPTAVSDDFRVLCFSKGLYLSQSCLVQTSKGKPSKRTLMCFLKEAHDEVKRCDLILTENGARSDAYSRLTEDFYLH